MLFMDPFSTKIHTFILYFGREGTVWPAVNTMYLYYVHVMERIGRLRTNYLNDMCIQIFLEFPEN